MAIKKGLQLFQGAFMIIGFTLAAMVVVLMAGFVVISLITSGSDEAFEGLLNLWLMVSVPVVLFTGFLLARHWIARDSRKPR